MTERISLGPDFHQRVWVVVHCLPSGSEGKESYSTLHRSDNFQDALAVAIDQARSLEIQISMFPSAWILEPAFQASWIEFGPGGGDDTGAKEAFGGAD